MSIFNFFRKSRQTTGQHVHPSEHENSVSPLEADLGYSRLEQRQVLNASFTFAGGTLTLFDFAPNQDLSFDQDLVDIGSGLEDVYIFDASVANWTDLGGIAAGDFDATGSTLTIATSIFGGALLSDVDIIGVNDVATGNVAVTQVDPLASVEFGSLELQDVTNVDTSLDLNIIGDLTLQNVSVVDSNPGDAVFPDADINALVDGNITVNDLLLNDIDDSAAQINLTATGTDSDIIINGNVSSFEGDIVVSADDSVLLNAGATIVSQDSGTVTILANATDTDGDGTDGIVMDETAVVDAGDGVITLTSTGANFSGDLDLGQITTTGDVFITAELGDINVGEITGNNVDVSTSFGSINDAQDDLVQDFNAAGTITLTAADEVGGNSPDGNAVDAEQKLEFADTSVVDIATTGIGDIAIRGLGSLTLQDLDTVDGSIDVMAAGNIAAVDVQANGATADVDLMTTADGIDVTLVTSERNVTMDADTGDITSGTITATNGFVNLNADVGDVTVGSITAGTNIDITTPTGSINDAQDDLAQDFSAGGIITLTANEEVGGNSPAGNAVDAEQKLEFVSNSVVDISTSGTGDIVIRGLGAITLQDLDTVNGSIDVMAAGNIAAVDVQANGATADVSLMTTADGITVTLVTGERNVTLDADTGDITSGTISATNGFVDINADDGDMTIGSITAGTNIDVTTPAGSINDAQDDLVQDFLAGGTITLTAAMTKLVASRLPETQLMRNKNSNSQTIVWSTSHPRPEGISPFVASARSHCRISIPSTDRSTSWPLGTLWLLTFKPTARRRMSA